MQKKTKNLFQIAKINIQKNYFENIISKKQAKKAGGVQLYKNVT